MRQLFVAGNWKMNLDDAQSRALCQALKDQLAGVSNVRLAVCAPYVYLKGAADVLAGTNIAVGAQNMYVEDKGAFTGEISGAMLLDVGCRLVILGHSERRHVMGESDAFINRKVLKALEVGLEPILCVGEKLDQREAGQTEAVVTGQLRAGLEGVSAEQMAKVTVAYEPVWAIGTGRNATPDQAQEAHKFTRGLLGELYGQQVASVIPIQYGGSVKPENAGKLMVQPDVDGALVGGASLKADSFAAIVAATARAKKLA